MENRGDDRKKIGGLTLSLTDEGFKVVQPTQISKCCGAGIMHSDGKMPKPECSQCKKECEVFYTKRSNGKE